MRHLKGWPVNSCYPGVTSNSQSPERRGEGAYGPSAKETARSFGSAYAGYSLMREYISHLVFQCHS